MPNYKPLTQEEKEHLNKNSMILLQDIMPFLSVQA